MVCCFVFCKQKTAYEMRISDWSSDVCSSDLESEFAAPLQRLNHVVSELQEGVMATRMQPIGNAWAKLPRIVRDLAHELDKKIDLVMKGAETEQIGRASCRERVCQYV